MRDVQQDLVELLLILLAREGGTISVSQEERAAVAGQLVYVKDPDKAGFTHLHLIPDYVVTEKEEEPPEKVVGPFDWPWSSTSGTTTVPKITNPQSGGLSFEMKLEPPGNSRTDSFWETAKKLWWTEPFGLGHKENTMGDTPKTPEQPAPPDGGGLQTTDPTFANQGGQAPKESKPAKKSDVTRKR